MKEHLKELTWAITKTAVIVLFFWFVTNFFGVRISLNVTKDNQSMVIVPQGKTPQRL